MTKTAKAKIWPLKTLGVKKLHKKSYIKMIKVEHVKDCPKEQVSQIRVLEILGAKVNDKIH
jgi:hypothetical protein